MSIEERRYWRKLKEGNSAAIRYFYDAHVVGLHDYGLRLGMAAVDVEDAIHDLFLDLYKYRHNLSDVEAPAYYLMFALKRKLIAAAEKNARQLRFQVDSFPPAFPSKEEFFSLFEEVEENERVRKKIFQEISKLPDRQMEVLYLRFKNDFTYDQIAALMGLNVATCRTLLYRAVKQLRDNLQDVVVAKGFDFYFEK
ncbi:MAG: RNA polymerase sigma factor [Nitritalea sp.]